MAVESVLVKSRARNPRISTHIVGCVLRLKLLLLTVEARRLLSKQVDLRLLLLRVLVLRVSGTRLSQTLEMSSRGTRLTS